MAQHEDDDENETTGSVTDHPSPLSKSSQCTCARERHLLMLCCLFSSSFVFSFLFFFLPLFRRQDSLPKHEANGLFIDQMYIAEKKAHE